MTNASDVNGKPAKKRPKIAKFADAEPALPTGQSSIEIIKNNDKRDLKTAAQDANAELASLVSEPVVETDTTDVTDPADSGTESQDTADIPVEAETSSAPELASADMPEEPEITEPAESAEETETEPEAASQTNETPVDEDGLPDDPVTNKAVEEIVAEEGDAVLAHEDSKLGHEDAPHLKKKADKAPGPLGRLWANHLARWGILGGLLVLLLAGALIPHSRYFVLNTAGVRSSLSLKVIDGGTFQPLKNVSVSAGGASAQTDSDGVAKLTNVHLGRTTLQIEKRAFSKIEKPIVVGWGSNPLEDFQVQAVGAQYTFVIKDYLSGKPIDGAEASSGDGNASSNEEGTIVLTLDTASQEDTAQINVDVTANGYRKETVNLTVNNKETQGVTMVPSRKATFVSKRSGKYDVYTVDIDGKNEQKIVSGTGLERDDITLVPHQSQEVSALVSTRERVLNSSGYLLSTLYIVDNTGIKSKIDQSEKIQIIGWTKDGHLVYVKVAAGASAIDPDRHRLMSFNVNDFADTKELASSNAFNDVMMAGDLIYYAPSNSFQESATPGVFVIDATGQNKQTILDKETFALQRSNYETLDMNTGESWYTYNLSNKEAPKSGQPAAAGASRLYADNPGNNFSLWVDDRDGKGVLLTYDRSTKEDKQLVARSGLKVPMYWLNDKVAVFRVKDSRETADYVISVDGGEARKITDVTDSAGLGRWFYY